MKTDPCFQNLILMSVNGISSSPIIPRMSFNSSMIHLLWITRELRFQSLPEENEGFPQQVLTGTVFLNFHHLHPEFLKFILRGIQTGCKTKQISWSILNLIYYKFMLILVSYSSLQIPYPKA